jgi:hypothetical protein
MKRLLAGLALFSTSALAAPALPQLGANVPLGGARTMSADSAWNLPVDHLPVDPQSAAIIASMGLDSPLHPDFGTQYNGAPWGIPYVVVAGTQPRFPVRFTYSGESDGVWYPIPQNPPIEGMPVGKLPTNDDADHHLIILDRDNAKLYELFQLRYADGGWQAGSGAVFDLFGDTHRPLGWTSADAAGLPIFPGLVRYDESVEQARIEHALRFTVKNTRKAYVWPASHFASKRTEANLPPMGLRVRLKASVDPSQFPASVRPIVVALKRYGMILADNGGNLFLSGAPDPRWSNSDVEKLKKLHARDFEVVRMGDVTTP